MNKYAMKKLFEKHKDKALDALLKEFPITPDQAVYSWDLVGKKPRLEWREKDIVKQPRIKLNIENGR